MRESLKRSLLVVASILVGLMALEVGLRASTWGYLFTWPNFVLDARTVLAERDSGRYVHDDRLGYLPRTGYAAPASPSKPTGCAAPASRRLMRRSWRWAIPSPSATRSRTARPGRRS